MKKVLYSKITKLILVLVSVLLVGNMLFTSYGMLGRHDSFCRDLEIARDYDYVCNRTPKMQMNYDLEIVFKYILELYTTSGIEGVREFYKDSYDGVINTIGASAIEAMVNNYILIADKNDIYSNFIDIERMEAESMNIEDNLEFAENYYTHRGNGIVIYKEGINEYVDPDDDYKLYMIHGVIYNSQDNLVMDGDEEINELLQTIDYQSLVIRLYLSDDFVSSMYRDYEADYYGQIRNVYSEYENDMIDIVKELVVKAVCLLLVLIVLAILCGKSKDGLTELNKWESKPIELHLLTIVVLCIPIVALISFIYTKVDMYPESNSWLKPLLNDSVRRGYTIGGTVIISAILYEIGVFIKKKKNKRIIKDCFVLQFEIKNVRKLKAFFKKVYDSSAYAALPDIKKKYIRKVITDAVVAIVAIVVTVIACLQFEDLRTAYTYMKWEAQDFNGYWYIEQYGYHGLGISLSIFMWIAIAIYYINSFIEYRDLRKYNKVAKAIETIYNGNYNSFTVEDNEKNDALKMLANLSDSFEESVRKQVEAEKMQIELVANVSHDLKTPLTSIISYVELLKEEEMSDVAKDYVKVLSDKSDRLKYIVSDVFDLAKATSGEQVPMEELDGVVLINQVLSDMQDKIEASGRDVRSKIVPESAPLTGNGQKLYRVFQNIIDNALKYSMPGTRIYLTADMEGAEFVVTLKNISEYEMDFTAEEIMSRFTRGDKARHSEGNGLGLSIAKSFTELMGGTFTVEIDDDVFKTVVRLR